MKVLFLCNRTAEVRSSILLSSTTPGQNREQAPPTSWLPHRSGIKSIEHFANGRVHQDCATKQPYSLASCRVRFQALAANGVWQTPTLAFYINVIPTALAGGALPHVEYASEGLLDLWRKNFQESRLSAEAIEPIRQMNQANMAAIREMESREANSWQAATQWFPVSVFTTSLPSLQRQG